jgi:hypothetical protein
MPWTAPTIVGTSGAANVTAANNLVIPEIAAIQDGDFLVAYIGTSPTGVIATPSGWTYRADTTSGNHRLYIFTRSALAADTTYTFVATPATRTVGRVVATRGGTWDTHVIQANAASTSIASPSITTAQDNSLLLWGALLGNGGTGIITPPATTIEQGEDTNTNTGGVGDRTSSVATVVRGTAGAGALGDGTDTSGLAADTSVAGVVSLTGVFTPYPGASTLSDNFDDNSIDTAKWPTNVGPVVETGGKIQADASAVGAGEYLRSVVGYSLIGSSVFVEVPTLPGTNVDGDVYAWLKFFLDTNNEIALFWEEGTLYFRERIAGVNSETNLAYDPVAHRWWRIRETGGNVQWHTSPDGTAWTQRRSKAAGRTWDLGAVELGAWRTGSAPTPLYAEFDNLNATPAPQIITAPFQVLPTAKTFTPKAGYAAMTGSFAYNHLGHRFDIRAALDAGGGVIVTTHPAVAEVLRSMGYAFTET